MTWQPIYILGLASMASAYLGGLPSDQMTIAVSPLAEQVLLNTTDRAEAVKSRVTVPQHDLDGNFRPLEEDEFFDAVEGVVCGNGQTLQDCFQCGDSKPLCQGEGTGDCEWKAETCRKKGFQTVYFDAPSYQSVNLSTFSKGSFYQADGSVQIKLKSGTCKLDTLLGFGLFGSVYACGAKAVKFIKGKEKATQCAHEYTLQHEVQSPFVVQAEEAFVLADELRTIEEVIPQDSLCIVMEKLDTDLRKMKQHFRGRLGFTKKIWLQVLKGVTALHEAHIIYRDLKPDNVLCNHDATKVKISDFGLASVGLEKPRHDLAGTPAYLAPEIVPKMMNGQDIEYTAAVDAWTLGILLYELYFGKTPFEARARSDLYKGIKSNKVQFPHYRDIPEAPFQMKDLIRKCLAKRPSDRPRVHDRDPGDKPLISSHPWLTGDKTHEQERLREWLTLECPLIAAVKKMDVEMVEILFMNGSSMDCKDENGKTPSHLAKSYKVAADKTATAAQQNFVKARSSLENNDFQVALQKVMAKQKKVMVINEILGIFKWNPPANNP